MEGEYAVGATVIYEDEESYANRTWQLATKDNDGKLYGIYFFEANEYSEGQTDVFELVKVDGLASGNEYLAVAVSQTAGVAWPEGYTKDPEGKTVDAKISNIKTMTLLQKDGETFYWGSDKIEYPPEGGEGTPWYSVYKGLTDKMEIVDYWGDKKEAVIAAPVEGMRNLTKDQEGYPEGYKTVIEKTGMYSYYCTNDVIKVSPSGTSTDPGTDPGTKPGEDTGAKDLTASETGVSISLTDGVPEGAELYADTIAQESVLGSRPELKEELPGLLSIYEISVRKDGKALEIKDNPMTVKIPMNDHLKGYKYYQAVYLGDPLERFDAVVEGDFLVFETDHLSQYAILGSNTPFETSEKPTDPDELPFQDVRNGDWFYDSAKYVYGHGLMTGLNDTTFGPGEPLARAQLAVILYRLSGSPEVTYEDIFPDVPDGQWYTDAVIWAQEKGIVTGYSDTGTFKPGKEINRQEITTMMYRYAKYQGYSLEGGADYSSYPDAANVQEFAKDSMSWAVGNGIVTGKENPTRLDPLGNTARAECATIMMRFVEKFGK